MRLDEIILDLKILANIQQNGKICAAQDGHIALEKRHTLQGFRRLLSGDSRKHAVEKINAIVDNAFEKANDLLRSKYIDIYERSIKPLETEIQRHDTDIEHLQALATEFNNASRGLENLCETYTDDAEISSKLRIIIDKIRHKATSIEMKIERYHTQHVNKPVSPDDDE